MPRTEAGKRLLQWFKSEVYNPGMSYDPDDFGEDVDAIEAEARLPIQRRRSERLQTLVAEAVAAERARIRAAVDEMDGADRNPNAHPEVRRGWRQARAAVLAIIDGAPDA